MFSSRLTFDLRPNPLSVLLQEKLRGGARVLDLTGSNPTRAGFDYPEGEILDALANPAALRYDPSPRGLPAARQAVSRYYAARGETVAPSRILLTASTSEAYCYLFKLLTDPGDEILVPRPSYPLFDFLAAMELVTVKQYSLRYDGGWHVDFDSIQRACCERTRALVVVNPNNPTGSFLKPAEAERLEEFAAQRGIAILLDEVFYDYGFPDAAPVTFSGVAAFRMSGLSKIAGLPQMKLGWIVAEGPGAEDALERLEWIADTYLSVSTPVQLALPKLLDLAVSIKSQIRDRIAANLRTLSGIQGSPVSLLTFEGGWSATLQVPRTRSEEEWTLLLLRDHNILTQPGFFYDFESEAFLVLSLLTDPATFRAGISRILDVSAGSAAAD